MTDIERQHLRDHFLEPETRCGFLVDEKRKKLWKCMLDMLEILDRTCKKHGLRYFMFYGSLLGAIRHKGFIPWDDDLDIVMPRPDFDRIQKILEKELEFPYFLQNAATDPGFAPSFFKIRNSATAAITPWWVDHHYVANLGIFVDVSPIDGFPGHPRKLRDIARLSAAVTTAQFLKTGWEPRKMGWRPRKGKRAYQTATKLLSVLFGRRSLHRMVASISRLALFGKTTECAIAPAYCGYFKRKHIFPTEWFVETETADFEYLRVPVPARSEDILTAEYGNWHEFVHGIEGGAKHSWMHYDTDRDYKTVLMEEFGYSSKELESIPVSTRRERPLSISR